MNHEKARKIMNYLYYGGFFATVAGIFGSSATQNAFLLILAIIGTVVMLGGLVFGFLKIRCPKCHKFLGFINKFKTSCQKCGEKL